MSEIDLRWMRAASGHAGWVSDGTVSSASVPAHGYWQKVARIAAKIEGRAFDYVSSATSFGFELGSFALPLLIDDKTKSHGRLGACALIGAVPHGVIVDAFGHVCEQRGIGFTRDGLAGGPAFTRGVRCLRGGELIEAMFGAGVEWSAERMNAAHEWAAAFVHMMRHPAARASIAAINAQAMRGCAMDNGAIEPRTLHEKRAVAVFVSFSVHAPQAAARLANVAGMDADRMLETAARSGPWPETFSVRVPRLRAALMDEEL